MNKNFIGKAAVLAATGLAVAAMMPAAASAATFTFDTGGTNSSNSAGNVRTFTGTDGTKVEVTGYSICTGTGTYYGSSCYGATGQTILKQAYVGQYAGNGLGVTDSAENGTAPGHTLDNSGWTDILVLQFDKAFDVTQLGFTAWGDTDVSYAFGSTNVPFSGTLTFANWSSLDAAFSNLVSSTGGTMSDGSYFTRPVTADAGNLFLVAAALPNPDRNADYVKLKTLTGTPAVPEPATWAMMMAGIGAVGMSMRRRKTAVSFA